MTTEAMSPCLLLTAKGEFAEGGGKAFEALAARLKAQEQPKLLLFVHGGLVPRAAAEENAERLDDEVFGWGRLKAEGWETAYLIWQSGLAETIRLHRDDLARDDLFTRIILEVAAWIGGRAGLGAEIAASEDPEAVIRVLEATPPPSPAVLGAQLDARGERVKAELPDSLTDAALLDTDLADQLAGEPRFRVLTATLDDPLAEMPETRHLDEEVRLEMRAARELAQTGRARGGALLSGVELVLILRIVAAGFRVLNRLLRKRDHGLGCTIVEEVIRALYLDQVGATAWSFMKQDMINHFNGGHAGARLIETLAEIAQAGRRCRVLTVGHSAGSVFAAEMAMQFAHLPRDITHEIVLLAPAIRMDVAAQRLVDRPAKIDGLRLFTMADELESADDLDNTAFGRIYQRSLLYLISGVLERRGRKSYADAPLLGLNRHLKPLVPLDRTEAGVQAKIARLLQSRNRLIYSESLNPDGCRTKARTHGTFDNDPDTIFSIMHIARQGWA
jgi:pimeloyl-ACP methyl ester carboxylesterase